MRFAAVFAIAVLALGSCRRGNVTPGIASGIQRVLPEGTTSIAGVRLAGLLKTEIYERMLAARVAERLKEFTAATGVDPSRDITEFVVAMANGKGAVIADGRFDAAAIEKRFADRGIQPVTVNGTKTWNAENATFALASRNTAILAPAELVASGLASKGLPPSLAALLPEVSSGAQLWAISTGDFKNFRAPERSNLQNLEKVMTSLDAVAISADLRFGLQLRATGFCAQPEDAVKLQTAIRGGMGLIRLSAPPEAQEAVKALDSVIVKPDGKLLRFAIDVTNEQIDSLLRIAGPLAR